MGDGSTDLVHGDPRVCGDHARGVPRDWGGGGRGHPTGQAEGARTTPNSAAGQNPQPSARSAGPPAGQDPGSSADRAASKARTGNLRRRGVRKDSSGNRAEHSTQRLRQRPRILASQVSRRSADELELRIRAFDPWPGSFTTFDGKTVKIHRAELSTGKGAPGEVLRASREGLEVACASGSLVLLEVQPEAKRKMSTSQFLAGHRIEVGTRPFGR